MAPIVGILIHRSVSGGLDGVSSVSLRCVLCRDERMCDGERPHI